MSTSAKKRKSDKRKVQHAEKQVDNPIPDNPPSPDPEDGDPENDVGQNMGCPFCFLNPCIVNQCRNAHWIGPGQAPSDHNPAIRKTIYYRFWSAVANLGGWNMPQYLAKKVRIGGGVPGIVYHKREIMPDCILKFVRSMYPNPQSVPYLGHRWE